MRKRFMVLILVLGVLFTPAIAFADDFGGSDGGDFSDKVVYGPVAVDVLARQFGVQVYSGNKFNAALCALGYNPYSDVFTSDVKAYLSNASTGGSFIDFADSFTDEDITYIGADPLGNTWSAALLANNALYGKENIWCAVYDETLFDDAKHRVQEILNGNVGGGGNTQNGKYVLKYDTTPRTASAYIGGITNSDNGNTYITMNNAPDNCNLFLNETTVNSISGFLSSGNDVVMYLQGHWSGQNLKNTVNFKVIPSGKYQVNTVTYGSVTFTQLHVDGGTYIYSTSKAFNNGSYADGVLDFHMTDNINFGNSYSVGSNGTTYDIGGSTAGRNFGAYLLILYSDGTTSNPQPSPVPPTQWPEPDPVTPTEPPEVPSPTPTEPPAEPTTPQFGIPQLPNIGLTTEPTYQTPDLSAVLDAMAKHCQHLQTCMTECFDSYYSSITQYEKSIQENQKEFLRSWFRVTLDTIRDCFDDLSDYLQRLFTWLADQMDFTFTGGDFDDSSIVWWLKRIYSKLGSGTTVRPTDPVVDPTGIGDWFDQLIKNFVLDLLALGQDFLADVVEMFRQLTTKFPISIPWDIVAILTLFAAEPETPVLNIPQYALTGVNTISQVGTYVIDMQDYDGVMSVVRNVEKVVFAFWLCWKIDFFKQAFDIMTGGK